MGILSYAGSAKSTNTSPASSQEMMVTGAGAPAFNTRSAISKKAVVAALITLSFVLQLQQPELRIRIILRVVLVLDE